MVRFHPVGLADPLTQPWELPASPLLASALALGVFAVAAALALRMRSTGARPRVGATAEAEPTDARGRTFWIGRATGLALLVLAIAAGIWGDPRELNNIAPALVVGAGWPLLVLASVVAGRVWDWLDPFDSLARLVAPLGAGDGRGGTGNVIPAIPAALAWVAYLTMWPNHLAPRSVATALLLYTTITLAGCLAVGRRTWLSRGEVFGVLLRAIAHVRRRRTRAQLAPGTHLVLATLAGGFVYGLLRDSQFLATIGYGPRSTLYSAVALGVCVAVAVALAAGAGRTETRAGGVGTAAAALVPAVAGLALALALARNRFTTSLQLVGVLAPQPFGMEPQTLSERMAGLNARPLGILGLLAVQIALLVGGCVAGAVLAARRTAELAARDRRLAAAPSLTMLAILLAVAVAAVGAVPA